MDINEKFNEVLHQLNSEQLDKLLYYAEVILQEDRGLIPEGHFSSLLKEH